MSSFCVLYETNDPPFIVKKLDINLWLFPGVFGGRVVYCDIGLKLSPSCEIADTDLSKTVFQFDLGLPFVASGDVVDLAPNFYASNGPTIANAVFGNSEALTQEKDGITRYDDGEGIIAFSSIRSTPVRISEKSKYSIVNIKFRNRARRGESNYIRIRFRVRDSLQFWQWHNVSGRRNFAVSDVRVNEFRETPTDNGMPDIPNQAVDIMAVHCLLIFSSKLRITQANPQPKYIRVLERSIWERYLRRRVSRSSEVFVIAYWRQAPVQDNSPGVTKDRPFRAYLDVERRGIRLTRPTVIIGGILIMLIVLLQFQKQHYLLKVINPLLWNFWQAIAAAGVVGLVTIFGVIYEVKPDIARVNQWHRKIEEWWYRQKPS